MNEKLLRNNLSILQKRYPELAAKLKKVSIPAELKLIKTNSRWPSLALDVYGKYFYFHSRENPKKEAQEQFLKLKLDKRSNVILLGVGLGYHLHEVLGKIGNESYLIVVEQHLPIFKLAMGLWDMRSILVNNRVLFFVDERPEDIFEKLKSVVFPLSNNPFTVLYHDTSMLLFRDYYSEAEKKIKDLIVWGRKNLEAGARFRRDYQRNIIKNLKYFLFSNGISHIDLSGVLPIVCAAGPSLEGSISFLKDCKGFGVIIAVDTALKPLLARDIIPDLVISIDPTEMNFSHFAGLEHKVLREIPLIIDPQVFFKIPQYYSGPIFCPRLLNSAIIDFFSDLVGDKGVIDKGMSVAHTALSVVARLGAKDVVFCGLDLSFLPDRSHISGVATFTDNLKDRMSIKVEGRQGYVFTDDVFFAYIKHFEAMISSIGINFWNMSWGAKIKGARFVDEKDIFRLVNEVGYQRNKLSFMQVNSQRRVNKGKIQERVGKWLALTEEIKNKARDALSADSVDVMRSVFAELKGYGKVISILEETMEKVAIVLSNRSLWEGKTMMDKFKLYFHELIDSAEFICEEVQDADIY